MIPNPLPVVCIVVGDFHGQASNYVTRLYGMLSRHCPVPFKLTCFSDQPQNVPSGVDVVVDEIWAHKDKSVHITKKKLYLFDAATVSFPEFLYLDISLIIRQDMAPLLEYAFSRPEDLIVVNDWNYPCYNSSVMRIRRGTFQSIYDAFAANETYPVRLKSDQDYIYAHIGDGQQQHRVAYFPESQIVSYKTTRSLNRTNIKAARKIVENAIIVKFHGIPKMHHAANPLFRFRYLFRSLYGLRNANFLSKELRQWSRNSF